MRITIVIDDADPSAATEAAQTISRAFVRSGRGAGSLSVVSDSSPTGDAAGTPDSAEAVNGGEAPRFDFSAASTEPPDSGGANGSTPQPGSSSGNSSGGPPELIDESAGPAPDLGGG